MQLSVEFRTKTSSGVNTFSLTQLPRQNKSLACVAVCMTLLTERSHSVSTFIHTSISWAQAKWWFFGVIVWVRAINWSFPSIVFFLHLNYSSRVYRVLWLLKKNKLKMQWSGHDPMALCEWSLSGKNVKWRTRSVFLKALLYIYDDFDWLLHHNLWFSLSLYMSVIVLRTGLVLFSCVQTADSWLESTFFFSLCDLTEANCTAALSDSSPLCPLVTEWILL